MSGKPKTSVHREVLIWSIIFVSKGGDSNNPTTQNSIQTEVDSPKVIVNDCSPLAPQAGYKISPSSEPYGGGFTEFTLVGLLTVLHLHPSPSRLPHSSSANIQSAKHNICYPLLCFVFVVIVVVVVVCVFVFLSGLLL